MCDITNVNCGVVLFISHNTFELHWNGKTVLVQAVQTTSEANENSFTKKAGLKMCCLMLAAFQDRSAIHRHT